MHQRQWESHFEALGRTRHFDVQCLSIQEKLAEGRLEVEKVASRENLADVLNRAVGKGAMLKYLQALEIALSKRPAVKALISIDFIFHSP